ncbi:MAG TPA: YdcF family protein [Verrucomicrobiae bacterium]|nr:YdcF family protein [Verrucomicrobiae bacterium]
MKQTADFYHVPSGEIVRGVLEGSVTGDRLEVAYANWEAQGSRAVFVVSGGMLRPAHIQPVSDAQLMAQFLRERQVPAEKIIVEDRAADTFENIRFTLPLIEKYAKAQAYEHWRIVVFSNKLHLLRLRWGYFWLNIGRLMQKMVGRKVPLVSVAYVPTEEFTTKWDACRNWFLFLFLHLLDPLGYWHPVAYISRHIRRQNGSRP